MVDPRHGQGKYKVYFLVVSRSKEVPFCYLNKGKLLRGHRSQSQRDPDGENDKHFR